MHTLSRTREDLGLMAGFALAAIAGLGAHEIWYGFYPAAHNQPRSSDRPVPVDMAMGAAVAQSHPMLASASPRPVLQRRTHDQQRQHLQRRDERRAKQDMVVLRFREHSWVTVIDSHGITRIHALYRTGDRLRMPHEIGMKILLGNPDGVLVSQGRGRIHVTEARPGTDAGNS